MMEKGSWSMASAVVTVVCLTIACQQPDVADALMQPNLGVSKSRPLAPSLSIVTRLYSTIERERTAADATNSTGSGEDDGEAVLTDVDARVLRAMMQDNKLNVNDEENMKKLLQRGIRSKNDEPINSNKNDDDGRDKSESQFSSAFFQKLGNDDNKLWRSLRRGAQDVLESARIFVTNRIERDAQLLGALSVFAWERAVQDVGRALPAATNAIKKTKFFLGNETSADEMSKNDGRRPILRLPFLGNGDAGGNDAPRSIKDEMTTPMDEIKAVGEDIRDIFQSSSTGSATISGKRTASGNRSRDRRRLKTTVSRGAAGSRERFVKSYERKQKSTIRKEHENVVQSTTRLASGVIDSAWELKREMQVEPNQPGYRSKELRLKATQATQRLTQSIARRFLGAGKTSSRMLDESKNENEKVAVENERNDRVNIDVDGYVESPGHYFATESDDDDYSTFEDTITADPVEPSKASSPFFATVTREETKQSSDAADYGAALHDIPAHPIDTLPKALSLERLKACIERPERTWLRPNDLKSSAELSALGRDDIEPVVRAMIRAQKALENAHADDSPDTLLVGVIEAAQMASTELADILAKQLKVGKETRQNVSFFANEPVVQTTTTTATTTVTTTEVTPVDSQSDREPAEEPEMKMEETTVVTEVVEAEVVKVKVSDKTNSYHHRSRNSGTHHEFVDLPVDGMRAQSSVSVDSTTTKVSESFVAEIVSDDDFHDAVGTTAKSVKTVSDEEAEAAAEQETKDEKPNLLLRASLRSLDVAFFVAEKTVTVGIPTIMSVSETITSRVQNVQSEGMGSVGWKPIESAQKGTKRY